MFNELTISEQYDINGGVAPLVIIAGITTAKVVKALVITAGTIFVAGAVKGCTDEAAKDK